MYADMLLDACSVELRSGLGNRLSRDRREVAAAVPTMAFTPQITVAQRHGDLTGSPNFGLVRSPQEMRQPRREQRRTTAIDASARRRR